MWLVASGAVAFVANCFGYAITAASQFRKQLWLSLVVTGISAGAAFALVPRVGLYGAAIATLTSFSVQVVGTCLILHRALKKRMVEPPKHGSDSCARANALAFD